jgi:hypothetical protein
MPLPYTLGSHGPEIAYWQAWFYRAFRAYSPTNDGNFGDDDVAAVKEMQRRLGLPSTGEFDASTASQAGYVPPVPGLRPLMFTVEGHVSNMFAGPVADTATQLESQGICYHQPIGYNCGSIPFDNASGVDELARLIGSHLMDNLVPFPNGTPWALGGFSQGGIVISDFYFDYLAPGKPLAWRTPDLKGVLTYGNPCRQTGSVADWAQTWNSEPGSHGLDPYRRFGLPGYPDKPDFWVDVYRGGDIFAENFDNRPSDLRSAVYLAVARGDVFDNNLSLARQIAGAINEPIDWVLAFIMAVGSGLAFLASDPSPHYSPFEISGGVAWMRDRLQS